METTLTILLAEDEFLIGESLQSALEDAGFAVQRAHSGTDAIRALTASDTVCCGLITDIRLGSGPTGWEVAREAREADSAFPIVYISGDSAHEHGVHGVPGSLMIQKPFVAAQVITAITTLLNELPPS